MIQRIRYLDRFYNVDILDLEMDTMNAIKKWIKLTVIPFIKVDFKFRDAGFFPDTTEVRTE